MIRDVGDVARVLNGINAQLTELSSSDLRTLDSLLTHSHDHVVFELNSRRNRRDGDREED